MIEPAEFIDALVCSKYDSISGVPCSNISAVFHALEHSTRLQYVPAATEGEAVGIAVGCWFAGKKAAVICQNSGVGNIVNPMASLNAPYSIPTTLFVSMRGAPGFPDESHHDIMGRETGKFLELLSVETEMLPDNIESLSIALSQANNQLLNRQCRAFLINPKVIKNLKEIYPDHVVATQSSFYPIHQDVGGEMITRQEAIAILMHTFSKYATIATTGYAYRELHATGDRANYYYMAGSMGHAAAIGLGVSINTTQPTIVLDGDGALLMNMGICATVGQQAPNNLVHIVLDNGIYESTGGQHSNANAVDFSHIAQACSYKQVWQCSGRDAIERFCQSVDPLLGPTFAHIRVSPLRDPPVSRPKIDLPQLAVRFREFVVDMSQ